MDTGCGVPGRATRVFRYAAGGFHLSRNGIARDLSINKRICGRGNYLYTYYNGIEPGVVEEVRRRRMRKLTTIGLLIGRRAKDVRGDGRRGGGGTSHKCGRTKSNYPLLYYNRPHSIPFLRPSLRLVLYQRRCPYTELARVWQTSYKLRPAHSDF